MVRNWFLLFVFLASVQNDTAKIRRHDQSAKLLVVYVYNIYICIYVRIFYARDSWPTTAQTWGSCSPDLSLGKRRRTRWRDNRMNWRSQFWKLVLQRQVPVSSCPRLVTQPHSLGRGAWQMVAVVLQLPILIHHSFNHTSMWDVFVYIIQWRSLKCDEKVTWSHSSSQGASVRRMGGYAQRERERDDIYIDTNIDYRLAKSKSSLVALSRDPLRRPTCMYYIYYCIYFTFIPAQLNIYACIYLHFTLRIKTFVVAYNNIYPCIYPHLCSHFLTYVFAFVITCSTFVVTYIRACLTFVVTYICTCSTRMLT